VFNKIRPKSLSTSILLYMVIAIAFTVGVAAYLSYWRVQTILEDIYRKNLSQFVLERGKREEDFLNSIESDLNFIAQSFRDRVDRLEHLPREIIEAEFKDTFTLHNNGTLSVRPDHYTGRLHGDGYLIENIVGTTLHHEETILKDYQQRLYMVAAHQILRENGTSVTEKTAGMYFHLPQGHAVAYLKNFPYEASSQMDKTSTFLEFDWHILAGKSQNPERKIRWTGLYRGWRIDLPFVTAVKPIDINGVFIAGVNMDIDWLDSNKRFSETNLPDTHSLIFSREGQVMLAPDQKDPLKLADKPLNVADLKDPYLVKIFESLKNRKSGSVIFLPEYDQYLAMAKVGRQEWLYVSVYPKKYLNDRASQVGYFILAAGMICIILLIGSLYFILKNKLTLPLQNIALSANRIAERDYVSVEAENSSMELNQISQSLNIMSDQIKSREQTLEEAQLTLKKTNEKLEDRVLVRTRQLQLQIEEKDKAKSDLEKANIRLTHIMYSACDFFWEMDEKFRFTEVSDRAAFANLGPEKIYGLRLSEIVPPEEVENNPEKWQNFQKNLEMHHAIKDFKCSLKTDERQYIYLKINGIAIRDDFGNYIGYRGAATDITQQEKYENMLEEAKRTADEANRAKSEFLSNMSHELRTPLNAILGFAQLMKSRKKEPLSEKQSAFISQIINSGTHLLQLINDILDLAKIETGKLSLSIEDIDFKTFLPECEEMIRPLAQEKDIRLIIKPLPSDLPLIRGDYTRFLQIMMNLCSNAIKYNKEKGQVTLCVERQKPDFIRISIADTGSGIKEKEQKHLFDPFNRLGWEYSTIEGSGIGLTITKQLVEQMGGSISYETTQGVGSVFHIDLPISSTEISTRSADKKIFDALPPENIPAPHQAKILYIEDNPANLELMQELIEDTGGLEFLSATSAEAGLEIAKEIIPELIIMDINLPEMDGYQALEALQHCDATKDIPVIAISANAMISDIKRGIDAGFISYLTKPIDLSETISEIQNIIDQN